MDETALDDDALRHSRAAQDHAAKAVSQNDQELAAQAWTKAVIAAVGAGLLADAEERARAFRLIRVPGHDSLEQLLARVHQCDLTPTQQNAAREIAARHERQHAWLMGGSAPTDEAGRQFLDRARARHLHEAIEWRALAGDLPVEVLRVARLLADDWASSVNELRATAEALLAG